MTAAIKLLGIAPYEELNRSMGVVGKDFDNLEIDIFTANLLEGQELAKQLATNDYDAIISRGGTADLIQRTVSIPVIDVSISLYDILSAIKLANNYTANLAIVGYASITETAHLICDILQYNIKIITLSDSKAAADVLSKLKEENYELVLCDAITNQTALAMSINTILITSGHESIANAYKQALDVVSHIQEVKKENQLLRQIFDNQSQSVLVLAEDLSLVASNLDQDLLKTSHHFLKKRDSLAGQQQYYHTHQGQVYQIKSKEFVVNSQIYYHCEFKLTTPPLISNSFGLSYYNRQQIAEIISKKLFFSSFIQSKNADLMDNLLKYYNTMLIFGQEGTTKTSLAFAAFLKLKNHTDNLIVIDARLLNDRLWKYLMNANNGPFLEENNTFLIKNSEALSLVDCQQLMTLIKDTKLLQRNNLLFTYNVNKTDQDEKIFNTIMNELDCSSIYSASLSERQNELASILTLLVNKINTESNSQVIGFDPKAMEALQAFHWTGNFYQLEQVIKKLVLNATSYYISEHQVFEVLKDERRHQSFLSGSKDNPAAFPVIVKEKTLLDYSYDIVQAVLEQNKGNQTQTAKQLGISRTTLWRYLKLD